MGPLYNTGIRLYTLAAKAATLFSPKVKTMISGQHKTKNALRARRQELGIDGFDVWFHASSLGEFEQARPLIERLRRERPELRLLLSFFSPSGYEVRKHYDKVDCVVYLPLDTPHRVRRFMREANPKMAIFVKYEFWGNYLQHLHKRGVPTYIIDSIFRPTQIFFKPWGGMFRDMLACYDHLFVQDAASQQLLASVGTHNVSVAGDTRFDRVTDIMRTTVQYPIVERWIEQARNRGSQHVLIAGSSWQPDEDCYLDYVISHPRLLTIIAPHEFNENRLSKLLSATSGRSMLYSDAEKEGRIPDNVQALIIDSFGKLSSLYRYGTIALIGGGFGAGIHNLNEAAVYNMPVLFGPNHHKFKEASDLINAGGAFEYNSPQQLRQTLDSLLAPSAKAKYEKAANAAGKYIRDNLGATDKIYNFIFKS